MLASAVREATNVRLDQTTIRLDAQEFQRVLDWMDASPSEGEAEGMKRLKSARGKWAND